MEGMMEQLTMMRRMFLGEILFQESCLCGFISLPDRCAAELSYQSTNRQDSAVIVLGRSGDAPGVASRKRLARYGATISAGKTCCEG